MFQAENRAAEAERAVAKLQKEVDRLEGELHDATCSCYCEPADKLWRPSVCHNGYRPLVSLLVGSVGEVRLVGEAHVY